MNSRLPFSRKVTDTGREFCSEKTAEGESLVMENKETCESRSPFCASNPAAASLEPSEDKLHAESR